LAALSVSQAGPYLLCSHARGGAGGGGRDSAALPGVLGDPVHAILR
jgi:hypothetical protein